MRNKAVLASLSMIVALISGCSTMSKHYCQQADWQAIGHADGAGGKPPGEVRKYWQGCADQGVTVDLNAYADGHNAGLVQYCTEVQGYQVGLHGEPYRDVCRGELEDGFLAGYAEGRKIYDSQQRVEKENAR